MKFVTRGLSTVHNQQRKQLFRDLSREIFDSAYPEFIAEIARLAWNITEEHKAKWNKELSFKEEFYVYALMDPRKPGPYCYELFGRTVIFSHEPFYIGKGKRNRMDQHVTEARNKQNKSRKDNLIRKLLRLNHPILIRRMSTLRAEAVAFALEKLLIRTIRRHTEGGPLLNLASGGHGASGYTHTPEHKAYLSRLYKGRKLPAEWIENSANAKRGVQFTAEHRRAMSEGRTNSIFAFASSVTNIRAAHEAIRNNPELAARSVKKQLKTKENWSSAKKTRYAETQSRLSLAKWQNRSEEEKQHIFDAMYAGRDSLKNRKSHRRMLRARNSEQITCPHCGKDGQKIAMRRWHFDNCKFK
jgi:hypothetical protein